jgi:hypothetical protein
MACTCCDARSRALLFQRTPPRATVLVGLGRQKTSIRLPALRVVRDAGRRFVNLADVWGATRFAADLSDLEIDFVGDDGFDTATRRGPRVTGAQLHEGYLDVEARDLSWQLELPCFYRVKGVARIVARMRSAAVDVWADPVRASGQP